eukprot:5902644-Pyramimonas_sp.AAC.1
MVWATRCKLRVVIYVTHATWCNTGGAAFTAKLEVDDSTARAIIPTTHPYGQQSEGALRECQPAQTMKVVCAVLFPIS